MSMVKPVQGKGGSVISEGSLAVRGPCPSLASDNGRAKIEFVLPPVWMPVLVYDF